MGSKRPQWYFRYREAVLGAGESYCLDHEPGSAVVCSRPAGHRGRHAAHGTDPDRPLWTWPASPGGEGGEREGGEG